jgi:hypothetical protein
MILCKNELYFNLLLKIIPVATGIPYFIKKHADSFHSYWR